MKITTLVLSLLISSPAAIATDYMHQMNSHEPDGYMTTSSIVGNSPSGPVQGYESTYHSSMGDQTTIHLQTPQGAVNTYESGPRESSEDE